MSIATVTITKDPVLDKLREAVGTVQELTIRKKPGRFKILNVRESKTGFAFDFGAKPASINAAYEYRLEDMATGRKFWSPPFSAKLKNQGKKK